MATHSSVLAWRIPGTGEPGGLPSMGSHRVGHDWSDLAAAAYLKYVLSYWSILDLQCCVNFCCTAKSLSYLHTHSFSVLFHYGLSQDTDYRSLWYTIGPCCLSILSLSRVWLIVTLWTVAFQAPLSMEFSRQDTGMGSHSLLQGILSIIFNV